MLKTTAVAAVTLAAQVDAKSSQFGQHMSPSFRTKLETSDQVNSLPIKKEPRVELSGYLYDWTSSNVFTTTDTGLVFGVDMFAHADLFASAHSPAYWVNRNETGWLVLNPHLFGEGSLAFGVTLNLLLWNLTFNFKLMGIKFAPLDFQFAVDLSDTSRYCSSVGYFQEVLDIRLEVEADAYECQTGLIGWSTGNDKEDCWWKKYRPNLPIFEVSFMDKSDTVGNYTPWSCSDDAELFTEEKVDPETGEVVIHPHGWEPNNNDDGGDFT